MKSILLSIKPEWVAKILNGEKTIEVRKKFPKDYVGWVYLYCSNKHNGWCIVGINGHTSYYEKYSKESLFNYATHRIGNGRVVARFWCDNVEEITCRSICGEWESYTDTLGYSEISQASCLANIDIVHYLKGKNGYAIHISKLEIFDEPKYLCDFWNTKKGVFCCPLTKAPQNYCYIEGE